MTRDQQRERTLNGALMCSLIHVAHVVLCVLVLVGVGGSDDSPHGVSVQARADHAPNWGGRTPGSKLLLITEMSSCRKILHLRISHDRHNRYNEHLVMNASGRLAASASRQGCR